MTTYTATLERAGEYGVLKAIGASGGYLYAIVVRQSVIVGVLGGALGTLAGVAFARWIGDWVPEFLTDLRASDVALVLAAMLATAVVASAVPVRRLNRIDPAAVFRA